MADPVQYFRVSIEKLMIADDEVFVVPAIRMTVPESSLETFGVKSTKPFDDAVAGLPAKLRPMTQDEIKEWADGPAIDGFTIDDSDDEE